MKTPKIILLSFLFMTGCAIFKPHEQKFSNCPVCGMRVDLSEAYCWKYKRSKYYFDSYNCKEAFKMNPEKFISKNTADKK